MSEQVRSGEPGGARRLPLTRRQVLALGVAAVPCLAGAKIAFELLDTVAGGGAQSSADGAGTNVDAVVARYDPTAHRWAFVVDSTVCIGCGLCVVACKKENSVPLDGEHTRTWVERHTVSADGTLVVDAPDAGQRGFLPAAEGGAAPLGAAGSAGPAAGADAGVGAAGPSPEPVSTPAPGSRTYFVPRLCMQCQDPPCTAVCPVGATFQTKDNIVLIDEHRCIGCGYCILACPYGARYIVPSGPVTPTGVAGVADKCTFCYHRITRGSDPACVDVCPTGARMFGDLDDPSSHVARLLRETPTQVMRPALRTNPQVHYVGLEREIKA